MVPTAENRGVVVTEAGSYLRLVDFHITQLKAQGPSRFCNESEEEEEEGSGLPSRYARYPRAKRGEGQRPSGEGQLERST